MQKQYQHYTTVLTEVTVLLLKEKNYLLNLWNGCMSHLDMHVLIWKSWLLNPWGFKLSWLVTHSICFLYFPLLVCIQHLGIRKIRIKYTEGFYWLFFCQIVIKRAAKLIWSGRNSGNRKEMKSWNCHSVRIVLLATLTLSCSDYSNIQTGSEPSRLGAVGSRAEPSVGMNVSWQHTLE